MSRMFCTVKEAAETLGASEDQINTLLERGILHEFRQGPHRLVREAEVGALDLLRAPGPQAPVPAQPPVPARRPSPRRSGRATQRQVRRGATAVARPPRARRTKRARHKTAGPVPGTKHPRSAGPGGQKAGRPEGCTALSPGDLLHVSPSYAAPELVARPVVRPGGSRRGDSQRAEVRPPSGPPPAQTLRQWFWMGLVQDRPSAIALLSGLVLLALSALLAGICLAAENF